METHPHPPRPAGRNDFEIAIICALPLEYNAVAKLFHGHWNDDGDPYGKVDGDQNTYTTGWIGRHNVVLALLFDIGQVSAASAATSFSLSYTRVHFAILVGICGGIPQTSDGTEILLGDVVVSHQLVQYDFGRRFADKFTRKSTFTEGNAQSVSMRRFLESIQTDRYLELLPKKALRHLTAIQDRYPWKYDQPEADDDKLFPPCYRHKHRQSAGCLVCNQCTQESHPTSSGDSVMKSAFHRDRIAEEHNIIAFEMEGAGVFSSLPCLIIKGVCDYSDSHKNKKWQNYAAATAACVMKALIMWYPSADRQLRRASNEFHEDVVQLQHTNRSLIKTVKELTERLQIQQSQIPAQVPLRDLVAVNDALGDTCSFSLNFIDSLELFTMVLKRKFEHVGLGKIERGEWILQNRSTGHILDLNRSWKAVVKAGQNLDMSMIYRKGGSYSNLCPWCSLENECPSDKHLIECYNCSGTYGHLEELYKVCFRFESPSPQQNKPKHVATWGGQCHRILLDDKDDDIVLYTRVQTVNMRFRLLYSALKGHSAPLLLPDGDKIESQEQLVDCLARKSGLSREECLKPVLDFRKMAMDFIDATSTSPRAAALRHENNVLDDHLVHHEPWKCERAVMMETK